MAASAMVPLFVVGVPRSGTTLLSAMLNAHPRIAVTPETFFVEWALRHTDLDLSEGTDLDDFLGQYAGSEAFRNLGLEVDVVRRRFRACGEPSFAALFAVLLAAYAEEHNKARAGEKTPRHYLYVDTLLQWFPRATVAWMVRDPRAVVASLLRVSWASDDVEAHAWRWRRSARRLRALAGDERVVGVRYEDLVQRPEQTLTRLCECIGEPYDAAMLEYPEAAARLVAGEAHKANVLAPLDDAPLGRWRQQLSSHQIAAVEHIAGAGLNELGYERETDGLGLGDRVGVRARWLAERAASARRRVARGGPRRT